MTTTPLQIITAAYARSIKNRPGTIATDATELVDVVHRALQALFSVGARVNPTFFGTSASVPFAAGGWARPADAESVWRIEDPAGEEVAVVPIDDRAAEPALPAVYQLGQSYRPASPDAPDPQSGALTFFYSRFPVRAPTQTTALDSGWVEQFNDLLVNEVALYLAVKDGRLDEVAAITPDRDRALARYVAFLEHETANLRRRFGHLPRVNVQTLLPLLAGAPNAEVGA